MRDLAAVTIPTFPEPPHLDGEAVAEITRVVFDKPSAPKPCDVIFIFGGTHQGLWDYGAAAYNAALGCDIIVTGGNKTTVLAHDDSGDDISTEATLIRDELIARQVPADRIHIEGTSTNTLENVLCALEMYDFGRVGSILAICKSYAVGRQCRTLRQHTATHIQVNPYSFDTTIRREGPIITRENWMTTRRSTAFIFGQFLKILKYGQLGHLEPLATISSALHDAVRQWVGTTRTMKSTPRA